MLNSRKFPRIKVRQRGASAVEFGIIAVLFFTLFFGIIEFGRVFYLYNTVQEVTRCAARQATVTWKDSASWGYTQSNSIPQQCLFGADELAAGWEIHGVNVRLRALNLQYGEADPDSIDENLSNCALCPTNAYDAAKSECTRCIRFVEASLWCDSGDYCDQTTHRIKYSPMFGLIPLPASGIQLPPSTVTMPAESLGY